MSPELKTQASALRDWMVDAALPFWAGIQEENGAWPEELRKDGTANRAAVRRHRVQARQAYTYALATHLGWYKGADIVHSTTDFMWEAGQHADGPGLIHRLNADGSVASARRDLYDHAFYMLALAWAEHVVGGQKMRILQLSSLLQRLTHKAGGYHEGLPDDPFRRQNPHMHMFEMCLNQRALGQDEPLLGPKAEDLYALFETRFYDGKRGAIREYFEQDWTPQETPFEPGHAMEWVWLLGLWERQTGTSTRHYRDSLYASALSTGGTWLWDVVVPHPSEVWMAERETSRLWVQTELIKAHLTQAEHGEAGAAEMAAVAIEGLLVEWLEPRGTWVDKRGACGQDLAETIPTSTFYHLITLASEAARVSGI